MKKTDVKLPDYLVVGSQFSVPIGGTDLLARALRVVRDNCSFAYGKLVALKWIATNSTPYGATNGRNLLLNPDGLVKLAKTSNPVGYTAFLLVHEAYHALLGHGHRLKDLDPELANISADYAINWLIAKENEDIGKVLFPLIEGALIDERFADMSAVEIYRQLFKENPPTGESPDSPDSPTPVGQPSDKEGDGEGPTVSTVLNEDGEDGGEVGIGTPSPDDEDDEDDEEGEADGGKDGDEDGDEDGDGEGKTDSEILGEDFVGKGGIDTFKPEADPDEGKTEEEIAEEIEANNEEIVLIENMAQSVGIGGSASVRNVAEQNRQSEEAHDWASQIRDWMTDRIAEGWNKPFNAPMYSSTGMICAGRESRSARKLVVVVDTSGSIYDELLTMLLESVEDVLNSAKPEVIYLVNCDYKVRDVIELREGDMVPKKLIGGGGTKFAPAFEWTEENVPDCDGLIYLTDGDSWDLSDIEVPNFPVFWLSWWRSADGYPFGEAHRIDPHLASYDHGR